jgi:hypothetical protein
MSTPFGAKVFILHISMCLQDIKVIKPFLEFLRFFYAHQVHNIMGIMLDLCFKSPHVMKNLVGHGNAIWLASKYDVRVVIPLLMVCFDLLNLLQLHLHQWQLMLWVQILKRIRLMWGAWLNNLLIGEFFLFKGFAIPPSTCAYLLTWWHIDEG